MSDTSNDLTEIKKLISDLPTYPCQVAQDEASQNLGVLQNDVIWMRMASGEIFPKIQAPRFAIFAAHHGFALSGPQADILKQDHENRINRILGGTHSLCGLAKSLNCDLRLYEMDLQNPTQDKTQGPAMNEEECAMAMSYGMMSVEEGNDFLILGSVGAGSQKASLDLIEVINSESDFDSFELLMKQGGYEIAALCGVMIAAYLSRKPILIDSLSGIAAALLMKNVNEHLITNLACVGLQDSYGLKELSSSGQAESLCASAGFKLAQLKVLLELLETSEQEYRQSA